MAKHRHPDALVAGRYASSVHPTRDCVDFMREVLLGDLGEFYYNVPQAQPWRAATADADVEFPTAREIETEDWGIWHNAVIEQVQNASDRQIDRYYRQAGYTECPACDNWDLRATPTSLAR